MRPASRRESQVGNSRILLYNPPCAAECLQAGVDLARTANVASKYWAATGHGLGNEPTSGHCYYRAPYLSRSFTVGYVMGSKVDSGCSRFAGYAAGRQRNQNLATRRPGIGTSRFE